jgi:hypothetical protein
MSGTLEVHGNEEFVYEVTELFSLSSTLEEILITFEKGDGHYKLNQGSYDLFQ